MIKDQDVPTSLSTKILQRALGDDGLLEIFDQYNQNKMGGGNRPCTDEDLNILHDYREGMTFGELARKYRKSNNKISTAIRIAAVHKLG